MYEIESIKIKNICIFLFFQCFYLSFLDRNFNILKFLIFLKGFRIFQTLFSFQKTGLPNNFYEKKEEENLKNINNP